MQKGTEPRDRKRMLRLLIKDITVERERLHLHIQRSCMFVGTAVLAPI